MAGGDDRLTGSWRKTNSPDCARLYPMVLQFQANGHYRGFSEPRGEFTVWDVGTWQVSDDDHVAISTANDAVIRYAFALVEGALTFTDRENCRFSYRREA